MKTTTVFANLMAAVTLGGSLMVPLAAMAQDGADRASHHRQQTKNTWRNAAIGSGALGVAGLLTHNTTLGVLGAAGAVYSASRYEHDRRSQSRIDRWRRNHRHYHRHHHSY